MMNSDELLANILRLERKLATSYQIGSRLYTQGLRDELRVYKEAYRAALNEEHST